MAENIDLQISALERLWTRDLAANVISTNDLLAYARGAGAVMIDGSEVIRVQFTDAGTDAQVWYPKYVVMTAALNVLEADEEGDNAVDDPTVSHFDLSKGRIET